MQILETIGHCVDTFNRYEDAAEVGVWVECRGNNCRLDDKQLCVGVCALCGCFRAVYVWHSEGYAKLCL